MGGIKFALLIFSTANKVMSQEKNNVKNDYAFYKFLNEI